MRDILRANALAPGPITFGPSGLTVIYGGNAAGKSGVARILKKACHAQEPGARILPNVFEPDPGQPASATIDFLVDGEAKSHRWIDGQAKSQFLRAVNVFDSRCAAVRIEKASIVAYTPRILQLFRELALVVDRVAEGLKEEKAALGNQPASLASLNLDNTTEAGQFVANLSAKSSVDELETTCRFDNHDRERILSLNRALADDPEKRAFSEEARARRMQRLDEAVKSTVGLLDDIGSSNVQNALDTRNSAREAAEVARKAFEGNSDLAGVGSKAWRSLWESARKFSEMHAYANEPFPVTRSGAVCVLCQQKLSPEAGSRLVSFESFVKAEVQREADDAELELATAIEAVQLVQLPKSVTAEVREAGILGSPEGEAVRRFLIIAKMRRRYLLALTRKQKALHCPDLPSIPNLAAVRDGSGKKRSV
ncbi:MAG: hypothetical protein HKN10_18130, partial [Myxococcales bacterium]|nr:hypothetical protein [Myxococcales bacterium]